MMTKLSGHPIFGCEELKSNGHRISQLCKLILVTDKEATVTVRGICHTVLAGSVILLPPLCEYSISTNGATGLCASFAVSFVPRSVSADEIFGKRSSYGFTPPPEAFEYVKKLLCGLKGEERALDLELEGTALHRALAGIHVMLAELVLSPKTTDARDDGPVSAILSYIGLNYDRDITLASLSAALGYSPKYLSNCITALHLSFRDMLNLLRVEEARIKLLSSPFGVAAIAKECGFHNESSFHRVFRDIVGMTPAVYREAKRTHG